MVANVPRLRWGREAAVVAACVLTAVVQTWPLVTVMGTRICGDMGDPYQSLWGMRAFRDALAAGRNPFFTDRLYHPTGTTLVFQAFDIPSALLVAPLWGRLPEVAIYNVAVLVAMSLAAYGMCRLLRELTGDDVVALAGGVLYASVPYHLAHLSAHLYYVSTWGIPLYVLHLLRVARGVDVGRNGVLAGLFLALASLASWYHLVFSAVITPAVLVSGRVATRATVLSRGRVRGAIALAATFAVVAGPLLVAVIATQSRVELAGRHDPTVFSADLQSFVYPNAVQRAAGGKDGAWARWTGNRVENANYVGFAVLVLALIGAWRDRLARGFLAVAIAAAVLSLGPFLHVAGKASEMRLPYWYLEHVVPVFKITGMPVRFGFVMYFGLVVAAALGLVGVRAWCGRAARGAGVAVVVAAVAVAIGEYWSKPLMTWAYPVPAPMRAWAADPSRFAVLDVWDYYRPMWHATIHGKPMVDGYLSRTPKPLLQAIYRDPVLRAIKYGGDQTRIRRPAPNVDVAWHDNAPDDDLGAYRFTATWLGTLMAPIAGDYELSTSVDDPAELVLDGERVMLSGECPTPPCETHVTRHLDAGPHRIRMTYARRAASGEVHLSWRPPDGTRAIVPEAAFQRPDGRAGLDVVYEQAIPALSGLGRDAGRAALRTDAIRYVVLSDRRNACVEDELALPLVYAGEDVRIFEVPPD